MRQDVQKKKNGGNSLAQMCCEIVFRRWKYTGLMEIYLLSVGSQFMTIQEHRMLELQDSVWNPCILRVENGA